MQCTRTIVNHRCIEVPVSFVFNFQYAQEGVSALLKPGIAWFAPYSVNAGPPALAYHDDMLPLHLAIQPFRS